MLFELSLIYALFNFRDCAELKYFLFFITIFADLIASSSMLAKLLLTKINILLIYISMIPNNSDLKK